MENEPVRSGISRVIVFDQELPAPKTVQRVQVRRITIGPGTASGLHTHNGPVFGSIESGSAVYRIDGQQEVVLRPGDVFYEPEGVRIARFDALDEGVVFLAYFPVGPDQEPELLRAP